MADVNIENGDTLNTIMAGKVRQFRNCSYIRCRCGHCGAYRLALDGFCADCTALKDKANRALEGLLALAFRTPLTDEEIEKVMNEPVELSAEDKAAIDSWDIDRVMQIIKEQGNG